MVLVGSQLGDFVRGAYVALVLTFSDMDRIGHPKGFVVEDLGHDRYLVIANDLTRGYKA